MTIEEFQEKYRQYKDREKIQIQCENIGCTRCDTQNKDSALRNIKKNGLFKCRICSYTLEGRKRISEANSYKRTDETKQKMSEAKLAYFKTPEGIEAKKKLSLLTAKGHAQNKYENAKRNGWHESPKAGKVFYGSSYELRFCWQLDQDNTVKTYKTQHNYDINGRGRCLDFVITDFCDKIKAVEVKPKNRLSEQDNIDQINDSKLYSEKMNWDFEVCTEDNLNMTPIQIRDWADQLLTELGEFDWVSHRKEFNKKKAKKHYDNVIAQDKIEIFCEFCKETHNPLRLTYDKNIARNGRYICEKEGGKIAGSKPKKKKENPHAAEGKKQCLNCLEIKLFEEFGIDKGKSDGYANRCKKCRAEIAAAKYHEGK